MAVKSRRDIPFAVEVELLGRHLEAASRDSSDLDQVLRFLEVACSGSEENAEHIQRFLVQECVQLRRGLLEAQEAHKKLRQLHEDMEKPPWYPAIYQGALTVGAQPAAMVQHGGSRRAVAVLDSVDLDALGAGDEVLLDSELNLVVGPSSNGGVRAGETALFDRYTSDERIVLNWHDEEIVVDVAARLRSCRLSHGDRVRFDRTLWMCFERIEPSRTSKFLLEEIPTDTFAQIGGLGREIARIKRVIGTHRQHPEIVQRYQAERKGSILLVGSPGNGKTLIARATANWLGELSGSGVRFMHIKPAELHSVWYSKTEANYREVFEVARSLGESDAQVPVVMFFDEVDAMGAQRGRSIVGTDDRILNAFMTELDGLKRRGNVLVMAATNRMSTLDPALCRPGRLGDLIVRIPRPDRQAARQIFEVFLESGIPYASENGREELIGAALTRIYAPNSDNTLARLSLRSGGQVSVRGRDLISGAGIRNIVNGAKESAVLREAAAGAGGLRTGDLMEAIDQEFDSLVGMLTPANCPSHLSDLPDDADVVRIERLERRPKNSHRFLTVV